MSSTNAAAARAAAYRPVSTPAPPHGPVLLAAHGHAATDATARAARYAADRLGGALHVVAVLEPLLVYTVGYDTPVLPPEFDAERRATLASAVAGRLEPVLGSRAGWHLDVRTGTPARTLAEAARERRAGLLVVGAGRHDALDRLLGEEVALAAARQAPCPVLAVAPDATLPVRRAVVGVDFSAASVRAARTALALLADDAAAGPRTLTLVHARPAFAGAEDTFGTWTSAYDDNIGELFVRLRDLLRRHVPAGVTLETRARTGAAGAALRDVAAELDADLVAVGTHGAGWVERLFLGSVSTDMLRHAGRSVLVCPPPGAAERVRVELALRGHAVADQPTDWAGALDAFTRRNAGRRARLEVDPYDAAPAGLADGYRFAGAAYDPRDGRVAFMLGDAAHHVTHTVGDVRGVEIAADDARVDRQLLVDHAAGATVLTFLS